MDNKKEREALYKCEFLLDFLVLNNKRLRANFLLICSNTYEVFEIFSTIKFEHEDFNSTLHFRQK